MMSFLTTKGPLLAKCGWIGCILLSGVVSHAQPTISTQPVSQTVIYPSDVAFSVQANGTDPLSYQWKFNGTNVAGATNSSMVVTNVLLPNAGTYLVVVTNVSGSVTSDGATLTIDQAPPAISVQPANKSFTYGIPGTTSFNVGVYGPSPYSYQWRLNGAAIDGATGSVLSVTNANQFGAWNYSVVVSNSYGSVTSAVAGLFLVFNEPYNFYGVAAGFSDPANICIDTVSNLFVADFTAGVVKKVAPSGPSWIVSSISNATGLVHFTAPNGIAVDAAGSLYVVDSSTLRQLTPSGTNWTVTTLATNMGGGAGGTAVDTLGRVFFADASRQVVKMAVSNTPNWTITIIAGKSSSPGIADGTNSDARFSSPDRVAIDGSGALYVADFGNYAIRKITPVDTNWVVTTLAGTKGVRGWNDGPGATAKFGYVEGVAVDANNNVYVADYGNSIVRKISPSGFVTTLGRTNGFTALYGAAVDPFGTVYLVDGASRAVWKGQPALKVISPYGLTSGNDGFALTLSMATNVPCRLQGSSDLNTWSDLMQFTNGGRIVTVTNTSVLGNPQGFYRLISP